MTIISKVLISIVVLLLVLLIDSSVTRLGIILPFGYFLLGQFKTNQFQNMFGSSYYNTQKQFLTFNLNFVILAPVLATFPKIGLFSMFWPL
jgi:hypothetical protein